MNSRRSLWAIVFESFSGSDVGAVGHYTAYLISFLRDAEVPFPMRYVLHITIALATAIFASGCNQPKKPAENSPEDSAARPAATNVPLRVWITADVDNTELITRRWMAESDQPVSFEVVEPTELLSKTECDCDILVYPARLIGELKERKWIVELPKGGAKAADEGSVSSRPKAWQSQGNYGKNDYAVSLGCSIPAWIFSDAVVEQLKDRPVPTLEDLLGMLEPQVDFTVTDETVDMEAVVDRFLAIAAATTTSRNAKYGLLFDLRTMRSQLVEADFQSAARTLKRIAAQTPDGLAAVGTHSAAWKAACQSQTSFVSIASPNQLDAEAAELRSGGAIVQLQSPDSSAGTWNTGAGLVCSIASSCSQTSQSLLFVDWLETSGTRAFLAPLMAGIDASSPVFGVDSTSWKARQLASPVLGNDLLPIEPRMPLASEYRAALGQNLVHYLQGKSTASEAMSQASKQWEAISARRGKMLKYDYEESLGLNY
ncbi:MAG: hypothetical protein KDB22_02315 [Planctomycetales bacterium]|nr:hypothetical protein [Planctomycetales bacterium]